MGRPPQGRWPLCSVPSCGTRRWSSCFTGFGILPGGVPGHCPAKLLSGIRDLRRDGFRFLPLGELIRVGLEGGDLTGTVAITVDDGYSEFYRVGAPLFQELGCPVTVFLTTGFLDDRGWQWWDRLRLMMEGTKKSKVSYRVGDAEVEISWQDQETNTGARHRMLKHLTPMKGAARAEVLQEIQEQLGVSLPAEPTERFLPMTWEEVRELGENGVTFGPHSVTHGHSFFWTKERLQREVTESWDRIRAETDSVVPVFCYPYGGMPASKASVVRALDGAGMIGGLTTISRYASGSDIKRDPYFISRFAWPDDLLDLRQISSGIERAKGLVRRRWFGKESSRESPPGPVDGLDRCEGEETRDRCING